MKNKKESNQKAGKTKEIIFGISVILNIILAIAFVVNLFGAIDELKFAYVEKDTMRPDSLRMYLEREEYGVVANLSHPIRGGFEPDEADLDYYLLGEYADLLFLKEIFAETGKTDTLQSCEARIAEIREQMPDYSPVFDKIDYSAEHAKPEN